MELTSCKKDGNPGTTSEIHTTYNNFSLQEAKKKQQKKIFFFFHLISFRSDCNGNISGIEKVPDEK